MTDIVLRPLAGHQLDIEPSKDTSIRLPLEESDRLARSTHCLVPSRQGEPFNLVTSSDHAHTTVVLRRSVSDRLESPRADPLLHCSGRRIYECLNPHGKTRKSIAKGLPFDFGFPIVVHTHNADSVYVVPLEPMTRICRAAPRGLAQRERRRLVEAARNAECPGRMATSRSCGTRWTSTTSARQRPTSAPRPANSGSVVKAARIGVASSIRCCRSTP